MCDINNFENYQIYEDGRVWSKKTNRFLKPAISKAGYRVVSLSQKGFRQMKFIHRLIGEYYIDNPNNAPCIDHIDQNKLNNSIDNLRWVTHKENMNNIPVHKLSIKSTTGHKYINNSKYSDNYVVSIKKKTDRTRRTFKILEDAIDYRDEWLILL